MLKFVCCSTLDIVVPVLLKRLRDSQKEYSKCSVANDRAVVSSHQTSYSGPTGVLTSTVLIGLHAVTFDPIQAPSLTDGWPGPTDANDQSDIP